MLFACLGTNAQFGADEEQIAIADKLIAIDDDSDLGFPSIEQSFTFSQGDGLVTAEQRVEEVAMSLKGSTNVRRSVFYDEESSVRDARGLKMKGSKMPVIYDSRSDYEVNGLFYTDAKLYSFSTALYFKGDQRKYFYSKEYNDVKYLTSVYFHDVYPVLEKSIEFLIPEWLDVELREMNFEGYDISHTTENDGKYTKHIFKVSNLEPMLSERNALNRASEYPHILVLAKSFIDQAGQKQMLFNSTVDLYAWYSQLASEVDNDRSAIKPMVDELIAGKSTDEDKIKSIFYWVQDNIRYIAFENGIMGFKPASADEVFEKRYGDCKGMANLTKEMLSIAGYDARLTWIGTRGIPYDYSIPSLAVDNHMICSLFLEDEKYFLDATEEYIGFGEYAHRIQGRPVLIEDGDKFILDNVPEYDSDNNMIISRINMSLNGEEFDGKYSVKYTGEEKTDIIRSYAYLQQDKTEKALTDFASGVNDNFVVSNVSAEGIDTREGELDFNFDFKWEHQITKIGNETYFNADPLQQFSGSNISEDRKSSYTFGNKYLIDSKIEIDIPEGSKITYRPEDISFDHPDFAFNVNSKVEGGKLVISKLINIKSGVIMQKDFDAWNDMIDKLTAYYKEQFILTENN